MNIPTNNGLIKAIVIIIIAILILSYFGISLRSIINSPTGQENLSFTKQIVWDVWTFAVKIWNQYLKKPATFVFDKFVDLIWTPMIDNLTKMNKGEPVNYQTNTPKLPQPAN
jgi:hypothetical protein